MWANQEKAVGRSDAAAFRGAAIEVQAEGEEVRVEAEEQDGAAGAKSQSRVFDPGGAL